MLQGSGECKVIVSASSAAMALTFDAGGKARQKDFWVDDLEPDEAKQLLAMLGHVKDADDIVRACASYIPSAPFL